MQETYQKVLNDLEAMRENLTYVQAFLPKITAAECEQTKFYTVLSGETIEYFLSRDAALKYHIERVRNQEYIREVYAQVLYKNQRMLQGDVNTLIQEHGRYPLFSERDPKRYKKNIDIFRKLARDEQSKLRAMQDYGVRHERGTVTVYTLEYALVDAPETPDATRYTRDFANLTLLRDFLQQHLLRLDALNTTYIAIFGYATLQEARRNEPYLDTMLQSMTIHDIYNLHREHFAQMNAYNVIDGELSGHRTFRHTRAEYHVMEDAIGSVYQELGFPLQRALMRKVFDRPEVLNNINSLPFDWILSTYDATELDPQRVNITALLETAPRTQNEPQHDIDSFSQYYIAKYNLTSRG